MPSLLYQGSASQNQVEDPPDCHPCNFLYQGWKKKIKRKKERKKEKKEFKTDEWMGGKKVKEGRKEGKSENIRLLF